MQYYRTYEHCWIKDVNRPVLQQYLEEVWMQRFAQFIDDQEFIGDSIERRQGILIFDGNQTKTKNYIGFIQTRDSQIEIYPKVFCNYEPSPDNAKLFIRHLFFWFDYCRKWKFPYTKNSLDRLEFIELPELLISLMGDKLLEVISQAPISLYEEIEESSNIPRGRINFGRYLSKGFSTGNHHVLECDTEPFQYDNRLNRIIKYATRLLYNKTKFNENKRKLNDILFILDEVQDISYTSKDLDAIKINPFYSSYVDLIDICRLILDQQIYNNQYFDQNQWCLLFPMEYIFEDFVAGFLEMHFSIEWKVEYQKSEKYLTDEKVFQMQHDIFLTNKKDSSIKLIVDTKYKLRSPKQRLEKKKGVAQNDLYQMTSYAFRRGCNQVLLLYPNFSVKLQEPDFFTISSGFNAEDKINVIAAEIPFWDMNDFNSLSNSLRDALDIILKYCNG